MPPLTVPTDASSPDVNEALPHDLIRQRMLSYYAAATTDYRAWSANFNMHFGYWRRGMNPFHREGMLQEINRQVLARLELPSDRPMRLVDLGCGTGATARVAVACYPQLSVDAVTIVPTQIALGHKLNGLSVRGDAIAMHQADFAATPLPSAQFDAVYMIESACHAPGQTKNTVLRKAFRLLKPGGRFIMVDAMLRHALPSKGLTPRLIATIYRRWCASWAVSELCRLDLLPGAMIAEGFEKPSVEDWSWRVAPSVAHAPLLSIYFAVSELIKARGRLPLWRWRHIIAALLTPLLGLRRSSFAYVAVVTKKPSCNPQGVTPQAKP
jgi:ubiquinone/menaquinone biosynthesis C-methylase UbiE